MSKVHIKTDDNVYVLTGKDAGKTGKVMKVIPDKKRIIVEHVNMVTKHKKPRGRNQQGGIITQEGTIDSSNVMFVCSACKRPTKVGRKILENGEKVRICKSCGEVIDTIRQGKQ